RTENWRRSSSSLGTGCNRLTPTIFLKAINDYSAIRWTTVEPAKWRGTNDRTLGCLSPDPSADFFRRVLICLWHKTSPLGRIATATNSLIKCGGKQALKRAV